MAVPLFLGSLDVGFCRVSVKQFQCVDAEPEEINEADLVRTIFRRYLKLGSISLLVADLRKSGLVTKARTLRTGGTVGGIPFGRGMLAHVLRNRFYIGEVVFRARSWPASSPRSSIGPCSMASRPN